MSRPVIYATLSFFTLAGCQQPGYAPQSATMQRQQASAYAAQPLPQSGYASVVRVADRQPGRVERFRGPFDGGTATVTLTPQPNGRTQLLMSASGPNCTLTGRPFVVPTASLDSGRSVSRMPLEDGDSTYRRNGDDGLTMEQKGPGFSKCFYSGELRRIR